MSCFEKIDEINAVCFFPSNFTRARRFYEDVFGFQPKRIQPTLENPNFIEYYFRGTTVGIWERSAVAAIMGEENLLSEDAHNFLTSVKLKTPADVDEVCEEFEKRGVVFLAKPKAYRFGSYAMYVQDCDKNIWEFFAA